MVETTESPHERASTSLEIPHWTVLPERREAEVPEAHHDHHDPTTDLPGGWSPGELSINELHVNPQGISDPAGEWFEVRNTSERSLPLHGLAVLTAPGDGRGWVALDDPEALLAPGELAVIGREADTWDNGGVALDGLVDGISLSNEGGTLTLSWLDVDVTSVSWDGPVDEGAALSLDPQLDAWCASPEAWADGPDRGSPGSENPLCPGLDHDGDGVSPDGGDCDDADPARHPAASEVWYDGVDQDCDGWSDHDADFDGVDAGAAVGADCDDTDASVGPGMVERCNGVDDDCDGTVDGETAVDVQTWYRDEDGDGHGDPDTERIACEGLVVESTVAGDCDDEDATVSPAASEVCGDGVDNNCDGAATGCGLAGEVSVADASLAWYGSDSYNDLGHDFGAGDIDGDGASELVVGDPSRSGGGEAWLFWGPLTGAADVQAEGQGLALGTDHDSLGASVWVGDLDGDGLDDVALGDTAHDGLAENGGAVVVSWGSDLAADSPPLRRTTWLGPDPSGLLGTSLAGGEDLDGDGVADLALGAPWADGYYADDGAVFVVSAARGPDQAAEDGLAFHGAGSGDEAGTAIVLADLTGDGLADLVVSAPEADDGGSRSGAVAVFAGPLSEGGDFDSADHLLVGESSSDYVGETLALAGDGDGDGVVELLVGAPDADFGGSNSGTVYRVQLDGTASQSLSSSQAILHGESSSDDLGEGVVGGRDLDGDGVPELVLAAPDAPCTGGCVYVVRGDETGEWDVDQVATGTISAASSGDDLGWGLALPGDLDGDGVDDLLLGAPEEDSGASSAGAIYGLYGGGALIAASTRK